MVDFILAFFSLCKNVTVKTLLKSVHIYQSYCKKNLAQFFLAHPVCGRLRVVAAERTVTVGECPRLSVGAAAPSATLMYADVTATSDDRPRQFQCAYRFLPYTTTTTTTSTGGGAADRRTLHSCFNATSSSPLPPSCAKQGTTVTVVVVTATLATNIMFQSVKTQWNCNGSNAWLVKCLTSVTL